MSCRESPNSCFPQMWYVRQEPLGFWMTSSALKSWTGVRLLQGKHLG